MSLTLPFKNDEFKHKNDYSVQTYQGSKRTSSMKYVHNVRKYAAHLEKEKIEWSVMNVYARRSGRFLKRFYKNDLIDPYPR